MDFLLISLTTILALFSMKRCGFLPFPTLLIFTLLFSQIMFHLAHTGVIVPSLYATVDHGGLQKQYLRTHTLYSFFALFSFFSTLGINKLPRLGSLWEKIGILFADRKKTQIITFICIHFLYFHLFLFLSVMDWGSLWFHPLYLKSLFNPETLKLLGGNLSGIIVRISIFAFVASTFGFVVSTFLRFGYLRIAYLILSLFYFFYFLGEHSRFAVFYPFFIAISVGISPGHFKKTKISFLLLLAYLVLASALIGRGIHKHGFSAIPASLTRILEPKKCISSFVTVLTNTTEGIFIVAEGLQLHLTYPTLYKVLAYSPLPSLIDGYAVVQKKAQTRLHFFIPMPGLVETYFFGPHFIMLCLFIFLATIRMSFSVAEHRITLFIFSNFLIFFAGYHFLTYPTRNSIHFIWFAVLILLAAKPFQGRRVRPMQQKLDRHTDSRILGENINAK